MTSSAERYDEYDEYGPFGYHGHDVGSRAVGVLAGLSEDIPESFRTPDGRLVVWSDNDSEVFEDLKELETGIQFIEPHPDVDGGDVADVHRAFGRLHLALPLNEAERLWLLSPVDGTKPFQRRGRIEDPETLVGMAEEVTSAGVKQVIQGREVVRRLAAWRREVDEFARQGTLDEARDALGHIGTTLVRAANWPREHLGIRAELLDAE